MSATVVQRVTPVLPRAAVHPTGETLRRTGTGTGSGPATAPARGFQVLQSSRAPAQLCLFLRHGALDVK